MRGDLYGCWGECLLVLQDRELGHSYKALLRNLEFLLCSSDVNCWFGLCNQTVFTVQINLMMYVLDSCLVVISKKGRLT